jgi:hypothetical protein
MVRLFAFLNLGTGRSGRIAVLAASCLVIPSAVRAQATLIRATNPPEWGTNPQLVEEVRIGSVLGPEEYSLGSVGDVVVGSDGSIWVADLHASLIRRYDADGRAMPSIGRRGDGPGEFRYPAKMRTLPNGSVAIWDNGRGRVTVVSPEGAYQYSFPVGSGLITSRLREEFEVDRNGYLYILESNLRELAGDPTQVVDQSFLARLSAAIDEGYRLRWIKLDPHGSVLESRPIAPSRPNRIVDPVRTLEVLSPLGYVVSARNDEYAFHLGDASDSIVRIERPWNDIRYRRAERAEKQRLENAFAPRNDRRPENIPATKPVFKRFSIDRQGRLWVELHAPGHRESETEGEQARRERFDGFEQEWREPLIYEVVSAAGSFLGAVEFPNRQTEIMVASGQLVWVVEWGPFDEQYVVRYRIVHG